MNHRVAMISVICLVSASMVLSQQAGIGSVDGIVMRLGTTEPIAGVNIEMRRVEGTAASPLLPTVFPSGRFSEGAIVAATAPNPADAFYATTESDGAFRFSNLKPGKYRLLAAHPDGTYYPAEFGQRNPRGPGYDFSIEDVQSMKIRIDMAPMASVSGHVTGADGKPAAHAHVMAAEIAYQNSERVLNQMQGVETDERGNYRLFWLPPGRYYVGAFPEGIRRRQYTVPFGPPASVDGLNQIFSTALINYRAAPDGEVFRDVYETVYSPGETNPESANVIDLRLGSAVGGVDIALGPGRRRAVHIRGVVTNSAGQPMRNVSVGAVPQVTGPVTVAPSATTDDNGAYEIDGLMQGSYYITATQVANNSRLTAIQPLTVESMDLGGVNLTITAGFSIPGRVTIDGVDADGFRIGLVTGNRTSPSFYSGNSSGGLFSIAGVQAGSYRVNHIDPPSTAASSSVYLKSVRLGGADFTNSVLQLGTASPGSLEIELGKNGGSTEGRVIDARRQAMPNVMVVLVSSDSRRLDLFKTTSTDLAGNFRIQGIAPGNYLAFAWPWLPNGIWQLPDFLRTVENRGTRLVIAEGSNGNLELTLLPEVNF